MHIFFLYVLLGTTIIHSSNQGTYLVKGLTPFTNYTFRLRMIVGQEKGPFSKVVMAQTLEDGKLTLNVQLVF